MIERKLNHRRNNFFTCELCVLERSLLKFMEIKTSVDASAREGSAFQWSEQLQEGHRPQVHLQMHTHPARGSKSRKVAHGVSTIFILYKLQYH